MRRIYVTYLDHLGKYRDRFSQIEEAVPDGVEAIIFTKESTGTVTGRSGGITVIELPKGIWYRSIFLPWRLFRLVKRIPPGAEVVVQDWFKNFALVCFFRPFLRSRITFIYAPVISDFGWFYKRIRREVPACGMRYDRIRLRGAIPDFLLCKTCDLLLVQSKALIDFYARAYHLRKARIDFNYNGLASDEAPSPTGRIGRSNEKIRLGFVGNVEPHKGSRELEKLASCLPEGYEIVIAGSAHGSGDRRTLDRIRSNPRVSVSGFLDKERLRDFYGSLDGLLLLSYHEGSPRVVREFLPYGKPIFLFSNPGIDYCTEIPGICIRPQGDVQGILTDILGTDFSLWHARDLPGYVRENRLAAILSGAFRSVPKGQAIAASIFPEALE